MDKERSVTKVEASKYGTDTETLLTDEIEFVNRASEVGLIEVNTPHRETFPDSKL